MAIFNVIYSTRICLFFKADIIESHLLLCFFCDYLFSLLTFLIFCIILKKFLTNINLLTKLEQTYNPVVLKMPLNLNQPIAICICPVVWFWLAVCAVAGLDEISAWLSILPTNCTVFDQNVASKHLRGNWYIVLFSVTEVAVAQCWMHISSILSNQQDSLNAMGVSFPSLSELCT